MGYLSTEQNEIRAWVVNYYGREFRLTTGQRNALLTARQRGEDIIQIDDFTLSTNFNWIAPVEELEPDRLSTEESEVVGLICQWMDRPAQELDMTGEQIKSYAIKVVKRIGSHQAKKLYNKHANGSYPSVKGFMSAFKSMTGDRSEGLKRLG